MPPVLAAVPFAAGVGTALGTSAAVGGAVVLGATALSAMPIIQGQQAAKAAKSAAAAADERQQKAIADLKAQQEAASTQAMNAVNARRSRMTASNTIFTDPLGIAGTATTAKKQLLGM